jgi:hypothetical protein
LSSVEGHTTVHAYFHEEVGRALREHSLLLSQHAEWYVVQVLVDYTREQIPPTEPLALALARSRHAPGAEKAKALRSVGDTTLMLAGFFADSLRRSAIDENYYIAIGASAYGEAASLLRLATPRRELGETLEEMSAYFPRLAPALAAIGEESTAKGLDLLTLYERWMQTRSPVLERSLVGRGVILSRPGTPGLAGTHGAGSRNPDDMT